MSIQIVTESSMNGRDTFYRVASPMASCEIVHEHGGGDLWRVAYEGRTAMLPVFRQEYGEEVYSVAAECLSLAGAMAFAVQFVQEKSRTSRPRNTDSDDALEALRAKLYGH